MSNIGNKLTYILIGIIAITVILFTNTSVYATTEQDKQELIELLEEYKDSLGNLNQLKKVVDSIYDDLNSTDRVNDELKQKLNKDVEGLADVEGMSPLILQTLQIELQSQIEDLDDSNIDDVREEVKVIKGWVDNQVGASDSNEDLTNKIDSGVMQNITLNTVSNKNNFASSILPKAGNISTIIILVSIVVLTVVAIVSRIKYKEYKGIK